MALDDVYRTEARFLEHLQIQKTNFGTYDTEIGGTPADLTEISNDAANMEFLMETCDVAGTFKQTAFGIKGRFCRVS